MFGDWGCVDDMTDDELRAELDLRALKRKERKLERFFCSPSQHWVCYPKINDKGEEELHVINGGWRGKRIGDVFRFWTPSGYEQRTVTDWIEFTRNTEHLIPEYLRGHV